MENKKPISDSARNEKRTMNIEDKSKSGLDAKNTESIVLKEEKTPGFYFKARHALALMGFLGQFNVHAMRTNLSVAIVAMVNSTGDNVTAINQSNICPDKGVNTGDSASSNGVFNWGPVQQGLILGCYFYGYIITNVPGAWLARRVGVKKVFGVSMFFSSIITLLTPVTVYTSVELFVAIRIILGLFQGLSAPVLVGVWAKWAPPMERSTLISVILSGSSFGTCVTLPLAGVIAEDLGWEAVFYFTGGCGLLWTVFWFLLVHDTPNQHPRISEQERKYINESIGYDKVKDTNVRVRTPWKSMLTSLPLLGILCGHFASNWGNYTLLTMLPTYMSTILKFNLSASGFLSTLPYLLQLIFTLSGGYITDVVRNKRLTSTVVIRKLNTTLGLGIPALFIVLAGYIGCNATAAVAFFTLSVGLIALTVPGCKANSMDIAPKYGGIIFGISNTVANVPGFLAPQVTGIILQDGNSLTNWQTVFWISAGVYLAGALIYLLFGSGVEQSWARGENRRQETSILKQEENRTSPRNQVLELRTGIFKNTKPQQKVLITIH